MARRYKEVAQVCGLMTGPDLLWEFLSSLELLRYGIDEVSVLIAEESWELKYAAVEPQDILDDDAPVLLASTVYDSIDMMDSLMAFEPGMLVSGPILGVIAGGIVGSYANNFVAALSGLGIPEDYAHQYEATLKQTDDCLLIVHVLGGETHRLPKTYGLFQTKGCPNTQIFSPATTRRYSR